MYKGGLQVAKWKWHYVTQFAYCHVRASRDGNAGTYGLLHFPTVRRDVRVTLWIARPFHYVCQQFADWWDTLKCFHLTFVDQSYFIFSFSSSFYFTVISSSWPLLHNLFSFTSFKLFFSYSPFSISLLFYLPSFTSSHFHLLPFYSFSPCSAPTDF
jgi:hypothetical protein